MKRLEIANTRIDTITHLLSTNGDPSMIADLISEHYAQLADGSFNTSLQLYWSKVSLIFESARKRCKKQEDKVRG